MSRKNIIPLLIILFIGISVLNSDELPQPTYDNSLIFSITYGLTGSTSEISYIQSQFGNGIYAPLFFSHFMSIHMNWNVNPGNASSNISAFKSSVDNYVLKARQYGIGLHVSIIYGLARNVDSYYVAKEEDVRNAQWYNDGKIATQSQIAGMIDIQNYQSQALHQFIEPRKIYDRGGKSSIQGINWSVFGSLSRYARKLRTFHEAKIGAMYNYLAQVQTNNPDVTIVASGPGESELNPQRQTVTDFTQQYICDYSPFAIMEFRDWIRHEGMYGTGGQYDSDGYTNGGVRYQGAGGLANFNTDFDTAFATWDLKYYNWSLGDSVDSDYTDGVDPDPNAIPFASYDSNGMMPTSGPDYIAGGFDPPRDMYSDHLIYPTLNWNDFQVLWNLFRDTMVGNYVKDMASIVRDSGFPKKQYYTHQIPGDYLFGTNPTHPYWNNRYYAGATPMWTANAFSDTGMGITLYDIHYPTFIYPPEYARTSQYAVPAIDGMHTNWAALEYNPEVVLPEYLNIMDTAQEIYDQMIRVYNYNAHMISAFLWSGNPGWKYKGDNRETALKMLFDAVKDKARQAISTVFTPPQVNSFAVSFGSTVAAMNKKTLFARDQAGVATLTWSDKIWSSLSHLWSHWGDFKEFVIYRGYTPDFVPAVGNELGRTTNYTYNDSGYNPEQTLYYKIVAVNVNDESGPVSSTQAQSSLIIESPNGGEILEGSTTSEITWTSIGVVGNVKLEYSSDNGSNYSTIIASTTNDGSYNWTVPNVVSSSCLVRVSNAGATLTDASNSIFQIVTSGTKTIQVSAPNGSESFTVGDTTNITWNSTGSIANVKITYSTNNGSSWNDVVVSTPDDGTFSWRIPFVASTTCLVKIEDASDAGVNDTSNAVFTINAKRKDDLVGTWTGQGVYYRNSDTAGWEYMATAADKITTGDLDNDGIDDLIGTWSGQGGVWVCYSSTSQWVLLSSTADWIASGDMNGDGRDDLLGSWSGQGVYYWNPATSGWVYLSTPASQVVCGDLDGDGSDDLIGVWTGQGGVWIKYSSTGAWAFLSSTAVWIACADMNGDDRDDLVGTWTGQGVYYLDTLGSQWVYLASPANQVATGDLDGDAVSDLLGIWTGQGGVWVRYSSTGVWGLLSTTANWITSGRMRSEGGGASQNLKAKISKNKIEIGKYPSRDGNYIDLSESGPGGLRFRPLTSKYVLPGSKIDREKQEKINKGSIRQKRK